MPFIHVIVVFGLGDGDDLNCEDVADGEGDGEGVRKGAAVGDGVGTGLGIGV